VSQPPAARAACPTCGHTAPVLLGFGTSRPPEPGDWTVCAKCGDVLVFGAGGRLQVPTLAQLMAMPPLLSRLVDAAQRAARAGR